ncbi:hypothetical protein [Mycobacterium sp. E3198]|uniref:hypothetical protein n=1 Tax=Mycobacterium sp. E3198 TaxID=1834143 RepID=UPI000A83C84E|nr:hypothetical protein [Mycobacterium sp. E3198]
MVADHADQIPAIARAAAAVDRFDLDAETATVSLIFARRITKARKALAADAPTEIALYACGTARATILLEAGGERAGDEGGGRPFRSRPQRPECR